MRKKSNILLMIVLVMSTCLWTGCDDFFHPDIMTGVKEKDYSKNRNDLNAGALGIYSVLSQEVHKFLLWGSARADLVTAGQEGADPYVTEFVNNTVTELNPYTNYAGIYKAIARCNQQLENIHKVSKLDFSLTEKDLNAFYGEAFYLRALCYFYLVRTFKDFPIVTDNLAENIKTVTESGDTISLKTISLTDEEIRAIALKPANEQEVWKLISSDVNKALGMLRIDYKWNGSSLSDAEKFGRANLPQAFALGCDVALWMGEYIKASAYADQIIKNNIYDITSPGTWGNAFTATVTATHDLALLGYDYNNSHETNRLQEFTSNVTTDGGKYLLKPVKDIVDSLFIEKGDIRPDYTYKRMDRQDLIWKYIGLDGKNSMRPPYESTASWHLYRSADVYLLKGMAENRMGNYGGAVTFLNKVRSARKLSQYDTKIIDLSMNNLEDLLLEERARELAFEGKRWYDLLMVSQAFGRTDVLPYMVARKYPKTERAARYEYLKNAEHWYLPIDPERWK